jgi:transcription-repair coupling factor (superfamily II helicase)
MSASELLDDPATSLALPVDRRVLSLGDAARTLLASSGFLHVTDAGGAGPALAAHALALAGARHVLVVVADADAARRMSSDLAALGRGLPISPGLSVPSSPQLAPLLLATSENTPYAEVHGDRRASMARSAALFQMARDLPWRFAVVTGAGLLRRVAAPGALSGAGLFFETLGEIDSERVVRTLLSGGYLRAPVVEDPGTFAMRGGLLDVWPAGSELPLRVELDGDMIVTLRSFDPEDQRTLETLSSAWIPPAREALIDSDAEGRARAALRALCDAVDYPSTKARQLIDDVAVGHAYFGFEGFLPAFQPLVPLLDYFDARMPVVIEDPVTLAQALAEELERGRAGEAARQGTPHFPFDRLYVDLAEIGAAIERRPVLAVHRAAVAGAPGEDVLARLQAAPEDAPALVIRDHADLGRAVKLSRTSRGKAATLDPLLRRIRLWDEAGLSVAIAARTRTQAERVAALLGHRGVAVEVVGATKPDEPQLPGLRGTVRIAVAPLARGAVAPAEGFVLVTEEEIFGQRTHKAPSRPRSTRAMLEDLRALDPGDYVVHVDHGIGRYRGLEKKVVGSATVDLLVVEYQGGDKLFLPVYRLNQIQKYSGGDAQPKLDRLGGQTFAKTKARVQQRVRQMADELLRLYAERAALQKEPLPPPDDDYAAFEASFPYDETRDQSQAIQEVIQDLESPKVMDRLVCGDVGFGKTDDRTLPRDQRPGGRRR